MDILLQPNFSMQKFPLREVLLIVQNQTHRREVAVDALGRLGRAAKSALPTIARKLRAELGTARPRIVSKAGGLRVTLGRSSSRQGDEFPARASEAMIRIAPNDPLCAAAYAWRLAHDPTDSNRAAAALRLGSFGVAAAQEVPILRKALTDKSARVRWEVITGLGMIGPAAKSAVADLKKILAGKDKAAAARAKAALRQIEPR